MRVLVAVFVLSSAVAHADTSPPKRKHAKARAKSDAQLRTLKDEKNLQDAQDAYVHGFPWPIPLAPAHDPEPLKL